MSTPKSTNTKRVVRNKPKNDITMDDLYSILEKVANNKNIKNDEYIVFSKTDDDDPSISAEMKFPKEEFFRKIFSDIQQLRADVNDIGAQFIEVKSGVDAIRSFIPELKNAISVVSDVKEITDSHTDRIDLLVKEVDILKQNTPKKLSEWIKEKSELSANTFNILKAVGIILFIIYIVIQSSPVFLRIIEIVGGKGG